MNILKDPTGMSDMAFTLYAMDCEGEFDENEDEEDESEDDD